jgi:hypothetical protein
VFDLSSVRAPQTDYAANSPPVDEGNEVQDG